MIKTENLICAYGQEEKTIVIDSLNIEIEKGTFTAILGHNGSGKSTLAKHFNAIMLPQGGKVYIDKMDTKDETLLYDIRKKAGMVFQNPDNQMVAAMVEDEVAFAPENLMVEPEEIRKRVDECLEIVNMKEFAKTPPSNLSGGQKQRVAIASVLAMNPECIIFDEATAMLDPAGRKDIMNTVRMLNKERKMTVVFITHYMEEAALADRIIVLDNGKVAIDDVPKKVFSQVEKIKKIGLDVPQVTLLCQKLREEGIDLPDDIITIEECAESIMNLLSDK